MPGEGKSQKYAPKKAILLLQEQKIALQILQWQRIQPLIEY